MRISSGIFGFRGYFMSVNLRKCSSYSDVSVTYCFSITSCTFVLNIR